MIPYGRQDVQQTDIDAVVAVLQSDFLTQGEMVPQFESAVSQLAGANFGIAVNSATSALHIACLALGLKPGDRLWTVPNTFVASANCGRYCGAHVEFVDIDDITWNMSVDKLRKKLITARAERKLPKIVVPVHFAGQPTEQEEIAALGKEYGFKIVEDASHAIGAVRNDEPVGSCRWSDVTVFSFHPVKIITSGEGGMCLTNDRALSDLMRLYRSHGVTRDPRQFTNAPIAVGGDVSSSDSAPWLYEQHVLGYNYRMTDIHAALGVSQLKRLSVYIERRNILAQRYSRALRHLPLVLPTVVKGNRSAFHLYVVRLNLAAISSSHREVFDALRSKGIGVNLHYMPVHWQPYFRELALEQTSFPVSERYSQTAISLPLYPTLTETEQDTVIAALREVL